LKQPSTKKKKQTRAESVVAASTWSPRTPESDEDRGETKAKWPAKAQAARAYSRIIPTIPKEEMKEGKLPKESYNACCALVALAIGAIVRRACGSAADKKQPRRE